MLDLLHKNLDAKGKQAKLKSPQELQDLLDVTRQLLCEFDDPTLYATDTPGAKTDLDEVREKFRIVKASPPALGAPRFFKRTDQWWLAWTAQAALCCGEAVQAMFALNQHFSRLSAPCQASQWPLSRGFCSTRNSCVLFFTPMSFLQPALSLRTDAECHITVGVTRVARSACLADSPGAGRALCGH